MRRTTLLTAVAAGVLTSVVLTTLQPRAQAFHCEVPCGIYDDHARIIQLLEDATTIAKATDQIDALSGRSDAQSVNQLVRWINTKEAHATKVQETIAQYFLNQRVKPAARGSDGWDDYVTRLTEHHAVMVAAMKTKQSADPSAPVMLKAAIEKIAVYYPDPHGHSH